MQKRIGEKYITKRGEAFEIVEYFSHMNCTIQFEDGVILKNNTYQNVKNGEVKNPNHPSIYGVGYIGQGKYSSSTKVNGKHTKYYMVWHSMMQRCYSKIAHVAQPTYAEVTVCKEWHNFQNFAAWYENNHDVQLVKDWQLDKDILAKGNKVYSSETCCLIPREINILFTNKVNSIVCSGKNRRYSIQITMGGQKHTGTYNTLEEASEKCFRIKESHIKVLAEKYRLTIPEEVYNALINYKTAKNVV